MVGGNYYLSGSETKIIKMLLEKEMESNKNWYDKLKGWQQDEADIFHKRYIEVKELNDRLA